MNIPIKNFLLTGRILLFASALLFAGMLYYLSNTLSFKDSSVEATGTIVGYTEKDSAGKGTDYYPVIEYSDTRGTLYRINSDSPMNDEVLAFIKAKESGLTNPPEMTPSVKIRYNKTNPAEARTSLTFADLWGPAIAYAILALIFSITGTALTNAAETEEQKK